MKREPTQLPRDVFQLSMSALFRLKFPAWPPTLCAWELSNRMLSNTQCSLRDLPSNIEFPKQISLGAVNQIVLLFYSVGIEVEGLAHGPAG